MNDFTIKFNNDFSLNIKNSKNILVAGRTGSGKTTFLHKVITTLAKQNPSEIKLFLIDLKGVEFSIYNNINNLYKPVAENWVLAVLGLYNIADEIKSRIEKFNKLKVSNIDKYNEQVSPKEKLPNIVIIIDEACDLLGEKTKGGEVLKYIASNSYQLGVHLILATQMLNEKLLFPSLKANMQTKICFKVSDKSDSLRVVHQAGAESLETGEFLHKGVGEETATKYKV